MSGWETNGHTGPSITREHQSHQDMGHTSPRPIQVLLLLLLSGLLFLLSLGSMGLTDRDEGRNAEAGREMFASGDLVTPTFNGELRVAKPVFVWLADDVVLPSVRRKRVCGLGRPQPCSVLH